MYSLKSVSFKILVVLMAIASIVSVRGVYNTTPRDTSPAPPVYNYQGDMPEGTVLDENENFTFMWNEDTDVITVFDKRNDYTWKTGLDIPFTTDLKEVCTDFEDEFEDQFKRVKIDHVTDDKFPEIEGVIHDEMTLAYFEVTAGILELRSRNLASEYTVDDVTTPATKEDMQLIIKDVTLESGKTYQLSFDMLALGVRDFEIVLGTDFSQMHTTVSGFAFNNYQYTFTQTVDETVDLVINLGYFDTSTELDVLMRFDNILVEEYVNDEVVADTDVVEFGDFEMAEEFYDISIEELTNVCQPAELRMNEYFTAFANSLVTIEYYDNSDVLKYASSAAKNEDDAPAVVESFLSNMEDTDDSTWVLVVDFIVHEIKMNVYITFTEEGIEYDIPNNEITGEGTDRLASVILAPFQGASGGAQELYDASDIYDIGYDGKTTFKEPIPGYILIPDGSGTLIRYEDYNVALDKQSLQVYGANPTQDFFYISVVDEYIPFKTLSLPLFGMSHGDNQAGFVAYATEGDPYMSLEVWPEENITYYTNAFMRFEYRSLYYQVYNKNGDGNTSLQEDRNDFDIHVVYNYLDGTSTEGERADYIGMAKKYSEFLFGDATTSFDYTDIPIRLDFLMSDSEKSLIGYINQVTTTSDGVDRILGKVMEDGITNINSGLLGWNDGGRSLGDPSDTDFTREIGRKRDFEDLIDKYSDLGVDVSFSQDYFIINEEMMGYRGNAATHLNSWYSFRYIWDENLERVYFARPVNSTEWMFDQMDDFDDLGVNSYTITGITNNLISDYSNNFERDDSKEHFMNAFSKIRNDKLVNAYQPNAYLLEYVDRYLEAPVFGTQYLIETDTVPFLQLVLNGNMEVYSPYANFSFYTDSDVLRMIDYNVYPSFVLTEEPAHLLTDTLSNTFYSTEYELYEDTIVRVYNDVNNALQSVINAEWIGREVVEPGIIINTYSDGTEIVINYTDEAFAYEGDVVNPVSYKVY